jgi:hypothetical protein
VPLPQDVAELALICARDAVSRLVVLIGSDLPWADGGAAPETALIELTRRDEADHTDRASWEGHAALDLLMAARTVLAPVGDAFDEEAAGS